MVLRLRKKTPGQGYLPDIEDARDYTVYDHKPLQSIFKAPTLDTKHIIPNSEFTPVKHQGQLGSCTAFAGTALMEYYIKKATGNNYELSEKFLYWVTRKLLTWENKDTGAYLRTTMQALTRFGICEGKFFKYNEDFKEKPDWVHSALADDYQAETYMRLDKKGMTKTDILTKVKQLIARNYPIMFGFTTYENTIDNDTGEVSYPSSRTKPRGGHAVVITGYDDSKVIRDGDGTTTIGALKFRNSWGYDWGEYGYGWLPYEYILTGKANDFWMMFRADWLKLEKFE